MSDILTIVLGGKTYRLIQEGADHYLCDLYEGTADIPDYVLERITQNAELYHPNCDIMHFCAKIREAHTEGAIIQYRQDHSSIYNIEMSSDKPIKFNGRYLTFNVKV